MDDETPDSAAAVSAIKRESSASNIGGRGRLAAIAEEGYGLNGHSAWSSRWQHPLLKSIQARRGKASSS
jgi:hypothetical protein